MERVVKFSLLCPTPNMALLRGRNQDNINRVRNSTNARVSANQALNYTIVTLSAIEILENPSPAISAALQILPYCLETRDPHYKVGLVIEGQDRARLGEDFFSQYWTQQTLTTIIVSNRQQDTLIEIFGGNHGIRNALSMFLTHFRNSFFV